MNLQAGQYSLFPYRADWRTHLRNSLQAIQNCIDMGADMVEIDLKRPKTDIWF